MTHGPPHVVVTGYQPQDGTPVPQFFSGYTIVGACPRCGAPVYAPSVYHSILPPPSYPSCNCAVRQQITISTGTDSAGPTMEVPVAKEMPRLGPKLMVSIAELLNGNKDLRELLEDDDAQKWLSEMRALGLGGGKDDERRASTV